jgi:hypothetical protein
VFLQWVFPISPCLSSKCRKTVFQNLLRMFCSRGKDYISRNSEISWQEKNIPEVEKKVPDERWGIEILQSLAFLLRNLLLSWFCLNLNPEITIPCSTSKSNNSQSKIVLRLYCVLGNHDGDTIKSNDMSSNLTPFSQCNPNIDASCYSTKCHRSIVSFQPIWDICLLVVVYWRFHSRNIVTCNVDMSYLSSIILIKATAS